MTIKNFARSLLILVAAVFAPLGAAHADPNQGPGGPILVITNGNQNFGKFYAEILRTEGFNEFAVADIGSVTSTTLNSYDVVILAKVAGDQHAGLDVHHLGDRGRQPDRDGSGAAAREPARYLLGRHDALQRLSTRRQLHQGRRRHRRRRRCSSTAPRSCRRWPARSRSPRCIRTRRTATAFPAVTLRSVGASGGQAAAFMYDLATSIVYTRQGNPAWAGTERDGQTPRRSDDLFFGPSASDPQPDWVDKNKIAIPQADEQQRFLANLITDMNADRKPLPRFWYFPNAHRAVVVMTGDDHGYLYTARRRHRRALRAVPVAEPARAARSTNWECIRGTSYLFTERRAHQRAGGLVPVAGLRSRSAHRIVPERRSARTTRRLRSAQIYSDQKLDFFNKFTSITPLSTERHHCIVWSDWASGAKVQLANGIRLDTSYYYWPGDWVQNTPGHMTGSAMPMRFADLDGSLIDVYQVGHADDRRVGTAVSRSRRTPCSIAPPASTSSTASTRSTRTPTSASRRSRRPPIASAVERGVPVISARQMLTWLDGRGNSSFGSLSFASNVLNFTVTQATGATGLLRHVAVALGHAFPRQRARATAATSPSKS